MKIDWKRKLTSRKLWVALAGFISGVILAVGGSESTAATVSGCVLQGASVIGYLLAEGLTDVASLGAPAETQRSGFGGERTSFGAVEPRGFVARGDSGAGDDAAEGLTDVASLKGSEEDDDD